MTDRNLTPSQENLVAILLEWAHDYEADTLNDLLVRAGFWWNCKGHGYYRTRERCDVCSKPKNGQGTL